MTGLPYLAATVAEALVLSAVIVGCVLAPAALAGVRVPGVTAARMVCWGAVAIVAAAWAVNFL